MDFGNFQHRGASAGPSIRGSQYSPAGGYTMSRSWAPPPRAMSPPPTRTSATLPYKTPILSPATSSSSLTLSLSSSHLAGTITPPNANLPLSPPSSSLVNRKIAPSPDELFRTIIHHLRHRPGESAIEAPQALIHIDLISRTVFETFLNDHGDAIRQQHLKLEYDAASSRIIVYGPPTPYHDCTPFFLQKVLFALQSTDFDTPARQDTLAVREISFRSRDGSFLVPDAAVVVIDDEAPPRLWPTIVVEVANTQSYEDAVEKVKRWFVKSGNTVEVALLLKFVAKDPLVDPACFLEVYRARVVDADEGGESVAFDTESESSGEDELEEDEALDEDHPDDDPNEGSASPDEQPTVEAPSLFPVEPTAADDLDLEHTLQTPVDSDSSLSSLSDDELDLANLLPPPAKPRLQVYIAEPRTTVLPISDPEIRYLSLRYSDFFGSENVPEVKDPAEEVRLDLDILRREVRNLVRLTVRQVGSLKRSAKGGVGAGGKRGRR